MPDDRKDPRPKSELTLLPEVQGRIGDALATETLWDAWKFRRKTQAAITSLAAQQRLATATSACVQEHVRALASINQFFEAAMALQARKDMAVEIYDNQVTEERDRLAEAEHKRKLVQARRAKELLEADRQTLDAKHGLEATKKFKPIKFALGQQRAEARMKDAEVDRATAETAIARLAQELRSGGTTDKTLDQLLEERIAKLQAKMREDAADGEDTVETHSQLQLLKKLAQVS